VLLTACFAGKGAGTEAGSLGNKIQGWISSAPFHGEVTRENRRLNQMIELKQPLIPLAAEGLKTFAATQKGLQNQVVSAIADATNQVDAARAAVTVPIVGDSKILGRTPVTLRTGDDVRLQETLKSHARRQTVKLLADIRAALDKTVVPLIKTMNVNSDTAKDMAARQWDIVSVLHRAKGASTGTSGIVEAMNLRASYTAILHTCHPIELARWAQAALDTGDAVLSDCVVRENFSRPRDQRAFTNQSFLALLQNTEFQDAQKLLTAVTDYYQAALFEYGKFGREIGAVSLHRISMGLASARQNNDGSISPKNIRANFADARE
jgi:hypothetical protein